MKKLLLLSFLVLSSFLSAQTSTKLFGDLSGRQIGPAVMSGRISCLAAVPGKPEVVYVGSAGGGVWKTTSSGGDMRSVFDEYPQSIGAIAIDPSDPETVWVGTGETWVRNSVGVGNGIYRSTDGGDSWRHLGLPETERIGDIVVHPHHSDTVYVAALGHLYGPNEERGVFKTVDGGNSWTKILYLDENTGAADLSIHPDDPETLIVAMWSFRRRPWTFDSGFSGKGGLFKTTDGGNNWRRLTEGLPEEKLGRIAVDYAPSSADTVYASVETGTDATKGFYRSADGGESWTMTNNSFNTYVRPFYFSRLTVDPSRAANVAKAGYNGIISTDAGETFNTMDPSAHPDVHDVWINPENGKHIRIATDGGVYESFDRGSHFRMWQNLPVSQFYHVSVDMADPYRVYGGLQDNGSWFAPSRSPGGIENADWEKSYGGDGFYSFRHPSLDHFIFSEYQGGRLLRFDERTRQAKAITPYAREGGEKLRWNWNSPVHLSADGNRLYFGAQYLYRSTDLGDSWERISPDLTTDRDEQQQQHRSGGLSIDNSTAENYNTIYAIAEAPQDPDVLWVGSDDGRLHRSTDGGRDWTEITPKDTDFPAGSWITFIEPGPHDPAEAFVTFDAHRNDDPATYLYHTQDGGQSWIRITSDVFSGHALSVRQDPVNANLLFLGTENGLFVSIDAGESWAPFRNGVPAVAVRDMVIHPRESDLVLGTHGRGVIIIDDLELMRQLTPELATGDFTFLTPPPAYLRSGARSSGGNYEGSGFFRGPNPSEAVKIVWYAPKRHTFGKMFVEIFKDGEPVKEIAASRNAGLNVISIPTRLPKPKAAPTKARMALIGSATGPTLAPGIYEVKLTKGKKVYTTSFTLIHDPELPYPVAEREAQREAQVRLFAAQENLAYVYRVLEEIKKYEQPEGLKSKTVASLTDIRDSAAKLQRSLASLEGDGYVNETEVLREELGNLYYIISTFAGRPSAEQLREVDRITGAVSDARQKMEALLSGPVAALNQRLAKEKVTVITWPTEEEFLAEEETAGSGRLDEGVRLLTPGL